VDVIKMHFTVRGHFKIWMQIGPKGWLRRAGSEMVLGEI
jgi:hypothetical protein